VLIFYKLLFVSIYLSLNFHLKHKFCKFTTLFYKDVSSISDIILTEFKLLLYYKLPDQGGGGHGNERCPYDSERSHKEICVKEPQMSCKTRKPHTGKEAYDGEEAHRGKL